MNRSKTEGEAISGLHPVMEEWVNLLEEPLVSSKEKTPWRYNERAAVSSFAGAVWRRGGSAIEEFDYHKSDTSSGFGRCDLWCKIADDQYAIEFKYKRLYSRRENEFSSIVRNTLYDAKSDAKRMDAYNDNRDIIAGVFFIPVIETSRDESIGLVSSLDEVLNGVINVLELPEVLRAWHFLSDDELRVFTDARHSGLLHLGASLVLKKVNSV